MTAQRLRDWLAALAVYRDRRVLAIAILGFASGLPLALTGQTLQAWLTESGASLKDIGLFALVGVPYTLKFVWAPLVDRLPLPLLTRWFGRRRGWLVFAQGLLMAAIAALAFSNPGQALAFTALCAVAVAFASATQDIVIDAWRVEILEERQLAAGAAAIVFGYRIGMLVSSAGALYLATVFAWPLVYLAMAAILVIGVVTVFLVGEPMARPRGDAERRFAEAQAWLAARPHLSGATAAVMAWLYASVAGPFLQFMSRKGWVGILLFVMLFKLGDSLAGVLATSFYLNLGFTKAEIAEVGKLYGFAATMLGLFLGGWLMQAVGLYRALWVCGILQMVSNLLFAVLAMRGHDLWFLAFTVGVENLASGMGTAALVAYLSALCDIAYTATQYALLSSLTAVARTVLSSYAGFMAESLGWPLFFLATTVAALPGLALLAWLTRRGAATRIVERRPGIALAED
ncbi:AmpG family muropeptide MFS transporter [Ferrovibrio sp.]|uniref:AmpG family muropeptide MFS transporter n=1 Tax=Ferrovibrio sp. TaxID=1917215 RepID=UPI002609E1C0|nr:AmpG family muropeptide MFS transporter [Ferrovibrio sp.]